MTGAYTGLAPMASPVASVALIENAVEINPSPENPEAAAEAAEALIIHRDQATPAEDEGAQQGDAEAEAEAGAEAQPADADQEKPAQRDA